MDTLIDRYITAVGENLPAKIRKDTVTEIRSLIQDALDDRSKTEGKAPDDEMMVAVLKEFGPPEKLAAPYLPDKYLVGPRLFPPFILVLRIALPIIFVLVLLAAWLGVDQVTAMTAREFITELVKSLANALSAVVQGFGNIVLIFAILQWALPEFKTKPKEWDPRTLKAISEPDRIKIGELIVEIALTLAALIIFNFYPDRVGIYNNLNGVWSFTPILTTTFFSFIPWLDLVWGLTILLDVILLRKGSWQVGTRILAIMTSAVSIFIAGSLITRIPLLFTWEAAQGLFGGAGILKSLLNQVLIFVFVLVIILEAVKIVQMVWRLLKVRLSPPTSPAQ